MPDQDDGIAELLATVEEIRRERYPNLDPKLVDQLLGIQQRHAEDRAEGSKRTEQAMNQWAKQHNTTGE